MFLQTGTFRAEQQRHPFPRHRLRQRQRCGIRRQRDDLKSILAQYVQTSRPIRYLRKRYPQDVAHRYPHRASEQRIGTRCAEQHCVGAEPRCVAEHRAEVFVVIDTFEYRNGPRIGEDRFEFERCRTTRCSKHAAIQMESDDLRHHLGRGPIERHIDRIEVRPEFCAPTFDAEKRHWLEPRRKQSLRDENTLRDHQTFPLRQVGPAVGGVQIPVVVQPLVRWVVDIDHVGHGYIVPYARNSNAPPRRLCHRRGMAVDGITIRTAVDDDWPAILTVVEFGFATPQQPQDVAQWRQVVGPEGAIIALDGDCVVGVTMHLSMPITVPGAAEVDATGISWVSVAPTHRRRGILRALFTEQHRRLSASGVALSVLTASDAGIYGRFGYGPTVVASDVRIDRRFARMRTDAPDPGGVRITNMTDAAAAIPDIYDRWRRMTPAAQLRPKILWEQLFADREAHRDGGTSLFALLHADGYALYRRVQRGAGMAANVLEFRAITADAYIALWRTLFGLDLITTIDVAVPPDDPLPYLLTDSRLVTTRSRDDSLWLRIMNVPAALQARTYGGDLDVVLEVRDRFLGDEPHTAGGRFALTVREGKATCVRTDAPAQIELDLDVLGSLYFGAHRARVFAAANRLYAKDNESLLALDAAFTSERPAELGWFF